MLSLTVRGEWPLLWQQLPWHIFECFVRFALGSGDHHRSWRPRKRSARLTCEPVRTPIGAKKRRKVVERGAGKTYAPMRTYAPLKGYSVSNVTTIVLISQLEAAGVRRLESWARAREARTIGLYGLGESLTVRNDKTGGSKWPEVDVHAAGWNYFPDPEGLVAEFQSIPWERPDCVFLVLQPQEGPARVERPPFADDW